MVQCAWERDDLICSQGGVYYAFFCEDERPNFEQYTAIDHGNRYSPHEIIYLFININGLCFNCCQDFEKFSFFSPLIPDKKQLTEEFTAYLPYKMCCKSLSVSHSVSRLAADLQGDRLSYADP